MLTAQGTLLASLAFHCWIRSSGTHSGAPISQQVLDKFEEVGFSAKQKDIHSENWDASSRRILCSHRIPCQLCVSWGWRTINSPHPQKTGLFLSSWVLTWKFRVFFLFVFVYQDAYPLIQAHSHVLEGKPWRGSPSQSTKGPWGSCLSNPSAGQWELKAPWYLLSVTSSRHQPMPRLYKPWHMALCLREPARKKISEWVVLGERNEE